MPGRGPAAGILQCINACSGILSTSFPLGRFRVAVNLAAVSIVGAADRTSGLPDDLPAGRTWTA